MATVIIDALTCPWASPSDGRMGMDLRSSSNPVWKARPPNNAKRHKSTAKQLTRPSKVGRIERIKTFRVWNVKSYKVMAQLSDHRRTPICSHRYDFSWAIEVGKLNFTNWKAENCFAFPLQKCKSGKLTLAFHLRKCLKSRKNKS